MNGDDRTEAGDRPSVVVKFHDQVPVPRESGGEPQPPDERLGPWEDLRAGFGELRLRRVFTSIRTDRLHVLVDRARELDSTYQPANFGAYFAVDARPGTDLDALAKVLTSWDTVEVAYVDRPGPDPVVNALDDPRSSNQGYLDPAPDGIDAEYAWGFAGGDGAGQRIVDLERGWTFNHEDLTVHGATLLHGTLLDSSRGHGTSVLGQLCAADNTLGCVGIAPNVDSVDVVSFHGSTRPDAIVAALDSLSFGDVLLLEAQVWVPGFPNLLGPIEILDADYEAIRLATALGVIVVEAGGNGTNNGSPPPLALDTYTNGAGLAILNRDPANPDFRDSGAIIVTAATSAAPHARLAYGPHGRRIDCYGWGQNIDTCDSNDAGATALYRTNFGGTSGASPIVAGAALSVQGMAEAQLGFRFSPRQMRALLSDPATNTQPAATETTQIGVMPDLRGIIDSVLQLSPDLYLRDFVGDMGEPHLGPVSSSPDLILRQSPAANPQAVFGAGSGTENNPGLSDPVLEGFDHVVYVRALNQGGAAATDVAATVFWSPPSSLVTPDLWTLIGTVTIPTVPVGEQLTVSPAIIWPQSALPAPGHYCLVGLVGNGRDPAPGPADFGTWDDFIRFIRENNNVTWRNFNVVPNDPSLVEDPSIPRGFVPLDFLAPGAFDKARPMQLEVVARLPEGARLALQAPLAFLELLGEKPRSKEVDRERKLGTIALPPRGKLTFQELMFPARSRTRLRLLVAIPEAQRELFFDVAVRQLWEGHEVGRITWRLAPRPVPDPEG